ncbi:MAG: hypothetical protein NVS4B8_13560 [Herpetosiphon sp.]
MVLVVPLLSSCLLLAGGSQSVDLGADGGNARVEFVSADGSEVRTLRASGQVGKVEVILLTQVERGQLRIEVLDPQGSQVLVVEATSDRRAARTVVATDAQGNVRYRVRATGAHNGMWELLYQPVG